MCPLHLTDNTMNFDLCFYYSCTVVWTQWPKMCKICTVLFSFYVLSMVFKCDLRFSFLWKKNTDTTTHTGCGKWGEAITFHSFPTGCGKSLTVVSYESIAGGKGQAMNLKICELWSGGAGKSARGNQSRLTSAVHHLVFFFPTVFCTLLS